MDRFASMGPLAGSFMTRLAGEETLWPSFLALCDFGGRLAGSPGEAAARDWAAARLAAVPGGAVRRDRVPYAGWTCRRAGLVELPGGDALAAVSLLGGAATPPGGLVLEVVDCGRGTPDAIAAMGDAVRGRAALVRHEYPFAAATVHRRRKLAAAIAAGAAAFLIAQPEPGVGPVSGSAGSGPGRMIPALGVSAEAAARLASREGRTRPTVRLEVEAADEPGAATETLVLDLPGAGPDRVVLSAHVDGHALAESALDNATGVAAALALAGVVAPFVAAMPRGLTVCLFGVEEWALAGSRAWLDALPEAARSRLAFNLNLDSIAGSPSLSALTSGFPALGAFARGAAAAAGSSLGVHEPLMPNSDHANFAAHGIPAMRLLAGFDDPGSRLRHLLTGADTRALTDERELRAATLTAGAILWRALSADAGTMAALRA